MKRSLILPLLLLAGCQLGGSDAIEVTPENWAEFADKEITVVGTAGNSQVGAIVRFDDGGYIGLATNRPWALNNVGRTIEAKGKVVSGEGIRAERYLLQLESFKLLVPTR